MDLSCASRLVDAIQKHFFEIMDLLLDARASVHHSEDGLQLIHQATLAQTTECITHLVSKGAKLNSKTYDVHCYTPLQLACSRGLESSVRELLSVGASCTEEDWSHSHVRLAVLGRHTDIMAALLQDSSDLKCF